MNMKTTACLKCGSYMKVPSHYVGQEAKCVSCGYSFKVVLATSAPIRVIKPKSPAELEVKANNKSSSDKKLATRLSIGCGLLIILFSFALLYNQNLAKQNSLLKTTLEKQKEDISKKDETIKKINDDLIEEKTITKKLKDDIYKSEQTTNDINKQYKEYKLKSNSVISDYISQLKKTEALSSSLQSKIVEMSADYSRQEEQQRALAEQKRIENEQMQSALAMEKRRLELEEFNSQINLLNALKPKPNHTDNYDQYGRSKIKIDMPSDEEWELMHLRDEVESLRSEIHIQNSR